MPEGDEPSALRWMAATAEFPGGLPGGGVAPALRWMGVGLVIWGGGVVRGLGIEAVLDRVWCFCVIFKFIFGVFWIIIIEKDGWPDWLPDCLIDWLIDIRSFGDCFVGLER